MRGKTRVARRPPLGRTVLLLSTLSSILLNPKEDVYFSSFPTRETVWKWTLSRQSFKSVPTSQKNAQPCIKCFWPTRNSRRWRVKAKITDGAAPWIYYCWCCPLDLLLLVLPLGSTTAGAIPWIYYCLCGPLDLLLLLVLLHNHLVDCGSVHCLIYPFFVFPDQTT